MASCPGPPGARCVTEKEPTITNITLITCPDNEDDDIF